MGPLTTSALDGLRIAPGCDTDSRPVWLVRDHPRGAGALGLVSVGALGSLPLMALRRVLPAWLLAVGVAGGSAAGAVVLGRAGFGRLAAVSPEALEQRAKEAVENVADVVR